MLQGRKATLVILDDPLNCKRDQDEYLTYNDGKKTCLLRVIDFKSCIINSEHLDIPLEIMESICARGLKIKWSSSCL